jgi:N-acyl homoserine lactone hydrolase
VVSSHTHLDHIGNIEMFPKAIHVMQRKELYQLWFPEKFQGRTSPGFFVLADMDNAREFNFLELEGDYDLFGDGNVLILSTPGHTLGHQSMKVKLASRQTVGLPGPGELQCQGLHQFRQPAEIHARS